MDKVTRGKSSELLIAGKLMELGVRNVYLPVSDRGVDFVIELKDRLYSIQVKSVKAHSLIVGVKRLTDFLIIHYKVEKDEDEIFYLTKKQVAKHWEKDHTWKPCRLRKADRKRYEGQTLEQLVIQLTERRS